MQRPARYTVAIGNNGTEALEESLARLFTPMTAEALLDGRRGDVLLATPPLVSPEAELTRLGEKAHHLRAKSAEYLAVAAPWFVFADDVSVVTREVSVLASDWGGYPSGALALRIGTDRGEVVFIRDDITVGLQSGNLFHHRPPAAKVTFAVVAIEDGSAGDAVLTIAEYSSFMIPYVGPIVAGLISVFHSWARPPRKHELPNEKVVEEIGELMKRLIVAEDQAAVIGGYVNYLSAMKNANDDSKESITSFGRVSRQTLDENGSLIRAFNSLTYNPALAGPGVRAWSFAAAYLLLALRHGIELDAQAKNLPIHKSDYWRRLRLAYHQMLTHLGDVMQGEKVGLRDRLGKISGVNRYTHDQMFCTELPSGPGMCKTETYLDGFGFEDDGKRVGFRAPAKHKSEGDLRDAASADRNAYVDGKRNEFLTNYYNVDERAVAQIQQANAELLCTWHDSFENTILTMVKGWVPGREYPVLAAWPTGVKAMVVTTSGPAAHEPWRTFLDGNAGEIASGFLKADAPVFRHLGKGGGDEREHGRLHLQVPYEPGKVYALRIGYVNPDYLRSFRVRWSNDGKPVEDATTRVMAPCSRHQDTKQRTWLSRSITIPVESTEVGATLVIEGHDGWCPDIASLEWFELEHFPLLGA